MEATIRKKIIGKDELKAWMIARATKPHTLLLYRR